MHTTISRAIVCLVALAGCGEQTTPSSSATPAAVSAAPDAAAEDGWSEDFAAVTAAAAAAKRPILADFTGSDYCAGCIKLRREVFATAEFGSWAARSVILLKIDFPLDKPQSPELKRQNQALQETYQVEGYPTVLFLAADGRKLGAIEDYRGGGPGPWLAAAERILQPAGK